MNNQGFKVTKEFVQKTAECLRRIPKPARTGSDNRTPGETRFWVKLGDEDPNNAGRYKWTFQVFPSGNPTDRMPVIEAGNDYTAREINKISGLKGKMVEIVLVGKDDTEKTVYAFATGGLTDLIPVYITQDGGVDGDFDKTPTYTYGSVYNIITGKPIKNADGSIPKNLSPLWLRDNGRFSPADRGTGFFDSNGKFVLWQVNERESTC